MTLSSPQSSCISEVLRGLQRSSTKYLPPAILYDEEGSNLYEQIVQLDEYFPYRAESRLLKQHGLGIAHMIPKDCVLVELGCGTATKSALLIRSYLSAHGRCHYVGIDISESFVKQARVNLLSTVHGLEPENVQFIQADNMEGLRQARKALPDKLFCVIWLGSSIGNLASEDAVNFMDKINSITGPKCCMFLCTGMWINSRDLQKDREVLYKAYHDGSGITEAFIKNGMKNALASLGCSLSDKEMSTWEYHVSLNSKLRRVEMWITFTSGVQIKEHNIHIRPGESVLVEFSRKFSIEDVHELAARSNFYIQRAWRSELYGCQVLYSAVQALRSCWDDTDALLNGVADWKSKPIELRHPFLFYYGHVNAFTKLKLLNTMETMEMDVIFSRGINPYVLDPSKCHRHPEPPQEWPSKETICAYVQEVRSMVAEAVKMGGISMRLVHFVLEHERMHQETLQYMLAQETRRDFERTYSSRSPQSNEQRNGQEKHVGSMNGNGVPGKRNTPNVCVLPGEITMGADKCDSVFLWDNEMPSVETFVTKAFLVSPQPVSISEYMEFVKAGGYGMKHLWEEVDFPYFKEFKWPATWSYANGDYYVHEPGITKHWEEVANQPVYVSLAEAQAYSKWAGDFRVMTEEEYHRALLEDGKTVFGLRDGGWEWTSTAFRGFPGFEAMAEYEEYSVDFFDGQHFVLKGSSPWTHPALIRDSFRNFYQRQYRYVFAKFRCCKSVANEAAPRAESNGSNPHYRSAVFGHV